MSSGVRGGGNVVLLPQSSRDDKSRSSLDRDSRLRLKVKSDEPSRMKLDLVRRLGFRDESVEATKIVLAIVARASRSGE